MDRNGKRVVRRFHICRNPAWWTIAYFAVRYSGPCLSRIWNRRDCRQCCDASSAQTCKPDISCFPGTRNSITASFAMRFKVDRASSCRCFTQQRSGAGGRIDLVPVMHFDNLYIPVIAQLSGSLLNKCCQHGDTQRRIAGLQNSNVTCGIVDQVMMAFFEAGSADHYGFSGRDACIQIRFQSMWTGKIDQHIGHRDQCRQIVTLVDTTCIVVASFGNCCHQCMPHAPCAADNANFHRSFSRTCFTTGDFNPRSY